MKIAIIGAGYAGMSAAYDLNKAGHEVTIYESANHVGGLAAGFKEPHCIGRLRSSITIGFNRIIICWV